jgi:sterol desaturase/sphingolipid hydroxylase (fatty acid hydroxylase superfamily)
MNQSRIQAMITLVFWTICAVGFFFTVVRDGGPTMYGEDSARRTAGTWFLFFGLIVTPLARWIARKRWPGNRIQADERDERIQAKATLGAVIVLVIAVFLMMLGLWEFYGEEGCVPVGWMWVTAYGTLIAANLVMPAFVLLLDYRGWADG